MFKGPIAHGTYEINHLEQHESRKITNASVIKNFFLIYFIFH